MATNRAISVEVALNGGYDRSVQPNSPITPKEIIEDGLRCFDAGAAIIHFHCFDPVTGKKRYDSEIYGEVVEGIRAKCDAIVYGTLPMMSGPDGCYTLSPEERIQPTKELAERGIYEWCVMDCGSLNYIREKDLKSGGNGVIYANPVGYMREAMKTLSALNVQPAMGVWDASFLRVGTELHRQYYPGKTPIVKLFFSDGMTQGSRPRDFMLDAYIRLLHEEAPNAYWSLSGYEVDLTPLMQQAIAAGGNLRVGLEDAPRPTPYTNVDLVKMAVREIEKSGHPLAKPADVRAATA